LSASHFLKCHYLKSTQQQILSTRPGGLNHKRWIHAENSGNSCSGLWYPALVGLGVIPAKTDCALLILVWLLTISFAARADGQGSAVRNLGKLLSEKTKARVAIMHRWPWPWSRKVQSSMQTQVDSARHDTTTCDDMLLTSDPKKQELIDEIIPGLDCTCLEAKDPYYLLLIVVLAAAST
jgi:hypothetical protein